MKLLELFSGSGILSQTFKEYGHQTVTLDSEPKYNADICCNILDFNIDMLKEFKPNIIWASPECRCFSVASIHYHWMGGKCKYIPKTEDAKLSIKIIKKTIEIINNLKPKYYFIENPRGILRKLDFMQNIGIRHTITYCQYGDIRMKPTDIWTNNIIWNPRIMCHNGDSCHIASPRGSRMGTQGLKNSYERSKIPKDLCLEILKSCEINENLR